MLEKWIVSSLCLIRISQTKIRELRSGWKTALFFKFLLLSVCVCMIASKGFLLHFVGDVFYG